MQRERILLANLSQLRNITLKNVVGQFKEDVVGESRILQGVVRTDAFLGLEIPNNANAREFVASSKNVKSMITTLRTTPSEFLASNNGIRMIASEVIRNVDGTYTIYFDKEEGIVNGNHTATTLRVHGNERAHVPVFIQVKDFTKEELARVSTFLNSHRFLEEASRQDKLELHDWVKKALDEHYSIQYHEGGPGEISIKDVMKIAYIFYINQKGKFQEKAGAYRINKGTALKLNEKGHLECTQFVLKDIMDLYFEFLYDPKLIKRLAKPELKKFLMKGEDRVNPGLAAHLLSLTKAYMIHPNGYACWDKGMNKDIAKKMVEARYTDVINMIKTKKYQDFSASDILQNLEIPFLIESLRKTMELEYIQGKES